MSLPPLVGHATGAEGLMNGMGALWEQGSAESLMRTVRYYD